MADGRWHMADGIWNCGCGGAGSEGTVLAWIVDGLSLMLDGQVRRAVPGVTSQSGVALRLPPHSMAWRQCQRERYEGGYQSQDFVYTQSNPPSSRPCLRRGLRRGKSEQDYGGQVALRSASDEG